jgi:hypothetical protein
MKEALSSSETSVLTRATRRNNPEDTILHSPVIFRNIQGGIYRFTRYLKGQDIFALVKSIKIVKKNHMDNICLKAELTLRNTLESDPTTKK